MEFQRELKKKWFGHGFDKFSYNALSFYGPISIPRHYTYPHNLLIDIFYSLGIVGLAIFTLAILSTISILLRDFQLVSNVLPLIFAGFGIFVGSIFGGGISDFSIYWVVIIMTATLVRDSRLDKNAIRKLNA